MKKNFASNFSLVSLDAKGPRHARSVIHLPLFTLPQHTRRELEAKPGHRTQQPPSPGILQMGLHLWACSVWRWGAFDGPSPSRNAGRVCMVTGDLHTRSSNTSVEHAPRETRGTMQLTDGRDRLNACNYDRPRKGPIAIARSAARRGADRTARARCVCKSQQHVHFLPGNHVSDDQPRLRGLTSANGTRASDTTRGGAVESLRLERKLEVRFSGAD